MARTFQKTRVAVLDADKAAVSERPTKAGRRQQGTDKRVFPAGFYDDDRLDRRRRLADDMRKPEAKASDDPARLTHEADRWVREISNAEHRTPTNLLDGLDRTRRVSRGHCAFRWATRVG